MKIDWSKWQTIIQIPIVIIMCWATLESFNMRKTSQEQTIKNTMPILVMDIVSIKKYSSSIPVIKNVGYGPAFNVKLSDLKNREFKLHFDNISGLQKDVVFPLVFDIYDTTNKSKHIIPYDSTRFSDFLNYRGEHFMGRVPGHNLGDLVITYTDIVGKNYSITQSLYYDWSNDNLFTTIKEFPKAQ